MKYLLPITLIAATPALAQDAFERFEELSEASNNLMLNAMVESAVAQGAARDELAAALPVFEWNDAIREAGLCTYEALLAEVGDDGIDQMLNTLAEFIASVEGQSLEEIANANAEMEMPDGLTEERSIEITQSCGMIAAQTAWMADTGFLDVMMSAAAGGN